jgi:peptidoglycan hydrolase-like amidase
MCQSGAMGRADAGQTFEEIVKAYFKGVELGQLSY